MNNIMFDLKVYLDHKRTEFEGVLYKLIEDSAGSPPARLTAAAQYSLMAGGKRLRPVLCMAAAETVGGTIEDCIHAACALEMIHTYSLIHDDLPAMDNDDLRRGQPTCHVAFDEATALLAGDALLTMAFQILSAPLMRLTGAFETAEFKTLDTVRRLQVIQIISKAAGFQGMIEGQMQDIQLEGRHPGKTELEQMHRLKTGALIHASVRSGVLLGGGTADEIEKLSTYANHIGLAFQVADDILNVEGDPAIMGKSAGTDATLNKATYPSLMGLAASKRFAAELIQNAQDALVSFDDRAAPLRALAEYVIERRR
jgi:geranylgeranyl diphosphate synthase type II